MSQNVETLYMALSATRPFFKLLIIRISSFRGKPIPIPLHPVTCSAAFTNFEESKNDVLPMAVAKDKIGLPVWK